MSDAPVGVFDSGVGGLTVARAILDQLPHEPLLYLGDTAHAPYGPRPLAEVRQHALAAMDHLVAEGVKLLVIACNSASAACLADARERYDIPVVEVVLPATRRAMAATRSGRVGVIGTVATISSRAYEEAFTWAFPAPPRPASEAGHVYPLAAPREGNPAATGPARPVRTEPESHDPGDASRTTASRVELTGVACPAFVDFVERGITCGRQLLGLAEAYLAPLQEAGVDTLILGCTHYPLLAGLISLVMGDGVTLVNSAEETAKDTYRVLAGTQTFRDPEFPPPTHRFLTTGDPAAFTRLGRRFLGPEINLVSAISAMPARVPASTHAPDSTRNRTPHSSSISAAGR
jgi:glutamate racemase